MHVYIHAGCCTRHSAQFQKPAYVYTRKHTCRLLPRTWCAVPKAYIHIDTYTYMQAAAQDVVGSAKSLHTYTHANIHSGCCPQDVVRSAKSLHTHRHVNIHAGCCTRHSGQFQKPAYVYTRKHTCRLLPRTWCTMPKAYIHIDT
jgi:hypothetical protein